MKRNHIRKIDQLERVVKYAFNNVGNTFSAKSILADTALRYSVLGYQEDTVAASLENVVYLELCRRGYSVYIGKTSGGAINFVAVRQNEKLYVQITERIQSEKTEKREYEGIKTMHVADFLLSEEF